MKKISFYLLTLAFFNSGLNAQESYTIKSIMKAEGLPAEYAAFGEAETITYLKGDKFRRETTTMMGSFVSSFDGKVLTSLSDNMGNKTGFTATKEELEQANTKEKPQEKPKIEYTQEKKTIAGYECTKAFISSKGKDGKDELVTVWVTNKIKSTATKGKKTGERGMQLDFGDLEGHPMQIETSRNQMGSEVKITITTTEVQTASIDDAIFTANTEGYSMMSYKEMQSQKNNMRKGD